MWQPDGNRGQTLGAERFQLRGGLVGVRLLLVEDDELLRSTLKRDLTREGFAVDLAADGEQGEFLGATEGYDLVARPVERG